MPDPARHQTARLDAAVTAAASPAGWTSCAVCRASAATRRGHPLHRLRPAAADPGGQHRPPVQPPAGLAGRSASAAGQRSSVGPWPKPSSAARGRPLQPGADGAGQRGVPARLPRCEVCPVASLCPREGRGIAVADPAAEGQAGDCAVREAAVVVRRRGRILLVDAGRGRWAGLWDFPRFPLDGPAAKPPAESDKDGQAASAALPACGSAWEGAHDLQARRHALPHHAGVLRGRVHLGRPRHVRGRRRFAGCGRRTGCLSAFNHRPKAGAACRRRRKD